MANKITFNADTGGFDAPVQKSTAEVKVMRNEIAAVKKAATEAFQQVKLEAAAGLKSQEDLTKATQQYNREMLVVRQLRRDVANATQENVGKELSAEESKAHALTEVRDRLKEVREETEKRIATEKVLDEKPSGHGDITRRQQASAILRGGGLRAAESFATTLPGFDAFAGATFGIIGGVALARDLADLVNKFIEARDKARETASAIRDGFEQVKAPLELSTDELRKSNAELDISIAKLEHKPANTLALAMAEAAVAVDHLAQRADTAYGSVRKLLQEQRVGWVQGQIFGNGTTAEASNLADGGMRDIKNLARDKKDAVRTFGAESQQAKDADAAYQRRRNRLRSDLGAYLGKINGTEEVDETGLYGVKHKVRVSYQQAHGDQTANRNIAHGVLDVLNDQDDNDAEQQQNIGKQAKNKDLESQHGLSTSAAEAARKAAEKQRKDWEAQFKAWDDTGTRTASEVASWWNDISNSTARASANYLFALEKSHEAVKRANQESQREAQEKLKWQGDLQQQQRRSAASLASVGLDGEGRDSLAQQTSLRALNEAREDAALKVALMNVQEQARTGQISRSDAAVQTQTLHTMQYEAALQRLYELRAAYANDSSLSADQRNTKLNGLDQRVVELDSNRAVQVYQDAASAAGQTLSGALKQANAEWVQNTRDSARAIAGVYTSGMDGVNGDLTRFLTDVGGRHQYHVGRELRNDLGATARGIGGQLSGIGLRSLEGHLLGAFGVKGKADGSKSNPFYVLSAGGTGAAASSAGAGFGNILSSVGDDYLTKRGGAASTVAGLFGKVAEFGGFFADGGAMTPGRSYIVGEAGPELFTPGTSGFVTPNNALGGGGGGHTFNIPIDARGSTNPAETEATVHRAMQAYIPGILKAGMQMQQDKRDRMPSSRR